MARDRQSNDAFDGSSELYSMAVTKIERGYIADVPKRRENARSFECTYGTSLQPMGLERQVQYRSSNMKPDNGP